MLIIEHLKNRHILCFSSSAWGTKRNPDLLKLDDSEPSLSLLNRRISSLSPLAWNTSPTHPRMLTPPLPEVSLRVRNLEVIPSSSFSSDLLNTKSLEKLGTPPRSYSILWVGFRGQSHVMFSEFVLKHTFVMQGHAYRVSTPWTVLIEWSCPQALPLPKHLLSASFLSFSHQVANTGFTSSVSFYVKLLCLILFFQNCINKMLKPGELKE